MAACAHVWHYKCVSRLIHTPDYPMFQCPNCRAYTDLSAEVDDSNDYDAGSSSKQADAEQEPADEIRSTTCSPQPAASCASSSPSASEDRQTPELPTESSLVANVENMRLSDITSSGHDSESSITSAPIYNIGLPGWQSVTQSPVPLPPHQAIIRVDTPMRSESSDENPLTPRNDSGPLAFDGRAGMS
jgi:hypothetical protein